MAKRTSMRDDLDTAMASVRLSETKKAAILAAMKGEDNVSKKQWTFRTAVIAVALCAVLAVTALAVSPALREALTDALGGFGAYTSRMGNGAVSIDQDVEVRVVSTLMDKSGGSVYLEVRDLTGERFDGNMPCLSYDPESHTALLEKRVFFDWDDRETLVSGTGTQIAEDELYTLTLKEIYPSDRVDFNDIKLPAGTITTKVLKTQPLGPGGRPGNHADQPVLVPGQTPMKLEGTELFTLSSAGFDGDGMLHIQVKLADGVYLNSGRVFCTVSGAVEKDNSYSVYMLEGERYIDACFPDWRFDKSSDIAVEFSGYLYEKPVIKGTWKLTFPLEILPDREVAVNAAVGNIPGITAQKLSLSAMGARLMGVTTGLKNGGTLGGFPAWLILADGSTVGLERGSGSWFCTGDSTGNFNNEYTLKHPVEPSQVTGIVIGYWMIPIEGDTALPGHWLDALPQETPVAGR